MHGFLKSDPAYAQSLNPYPNRDDLNQIYNLIFCDDLGLYKKGFTGAKEYPWDILFSESPSEQDLFGIIKDPKLESRQKLLAFRLHANESAAEDVELLGVVIEVGLKDGLDVLAAFEDGSSRYINHSGKLIVWESDDPEIRGNIDALFTAGNAAIQQIGPWNGKRLPAPEKGNLRATFLTSNGIYFGEGPLNLISNDEIGGPVVESGTELMLNLIRKAGEQKK